MTICSKMRILFSMCPIIQRRPLPPNKNKGGGGAYIDDSFDGADDGLACWYVRKDNFIREYLQSGISVHAIANFSLKQSSSLQVSTKYSQQYTLMIIPNSVSSIISLNICMYDLRTQIHCLPSFEAQWVVPSSFLPRQLSGRWSGPWG